MIYWPLTQNGQYTCKNEYDEASQDMYSPQDSSFWKGVWSLQVPNKVNNLLWRACKNSIPTKLNLLRRAIIVDPQCDRCKSEAVSPSHALWLCNELDPVWTSSAEWNFRSPKQFADYKELLSWILTNHSNLELFAMTAWSIWNQRNLVRMHTPCCNMNRIAQVSKERLEEFTAVIPPKPPPYPKPRIVWKPPSTNMLKINFDGAVFRKENRSGVGVVIRNFEGLVLASLSQ